MMQKQQKSPTSGHSGFGLGVDQLPVATRGPQGLLCFFFTMTTPGASKKMGWPLILSVLLDSKATPYIKLSIYMIYM